MKVIEGKFGKDTKETAGNSVDDVVRSFLEQSEAIGGTDEILIIARNSTGGQMVCASNQTLTEQIFLMEALKFSMMAMLIGSGEEFYD